MKNIKRILIPFLLLAMMMTAALPVMASETEDNIDDIQEFLDQLPEGAVEVVQKSTEDEEGASEETPQEIPEERLLPRLVDEADLLSDGEEAGLLEKLDEISERQECDVVVVTVNSLEGKTVTAYADDFFDYKGYGYGEGDDGILLLVSMEDRDTHISTYGFGITALTDKGQDYIWDQILGSMSDGDYARAFTTYAELCDEFLTQAKTGEAYDVGNMPDEKKFPIPVLAVLMYVLGLLPAFIMGTVKKKSLKSVAPKIEADSYIGKVNYSIKQDNFLYTTTNTRRIPHDDGGSSGGGGSSTHTSSSGRSHGGSSRKF